MKQLLQTIVIAAALVACGGKNKNSTTTTKTDTGSGATGGQTYGGAAAGSGSATQPATNYLRSEPNPCAAGI